MSDTIGSNLEAGLTASCYAEQYLVTNQDELAEWFSEFEGMGTEIDDMNHRAVEKLAKLLGWERPVGESADDGQEELRVYYVDNWVAINATVGNTLQVIPRNEWDDWQARCPEWREGNGEPEEYDETTDDDSESIIVDIDEVL